MAAVTLVALIASGFASVGHPAVIEVRSPGILTIHEAHVGTTYNLGVSAWVHGPGTIEILSARALDTTPGLEQREALVGWGCDGKELWYGVATQDATRLPRSDVRPLDGVRLREQDRSCRYVLLRFVPRRQGFLRARGGEIIYRSNGRVTTARFDFETELDVVANGPDPREKKLLPQ